MNIIMYFMMTILYINNDIFLQHESGSTWIQVASQHSRVYIMGQEARNNILNTIQYNTIHIGREYRGRPRDQHTELSLAAVLNNAR